MIEHRDYWQERLSPEERQLALAMIYTLDEDDRARRRLLMKKQVRIDIRWGFFGGRFWRTRQWFYRNFVHCFMKYKNE